MPSDGPQTTNLLVGLELLTALLEHDDWTLEFVLAGEFLPLPFTCFLLDRILFSLRRR